MGRISPDRVRIHQKFIDSLGDIVVSHTPVDQRPLGVNLGGPIYKNFEVHAFPNRISTGRGLLKGEYKFCLSIPGQKSGEEKSFPCELGIPLLVSYTEDYDVFILYDAYRHFTFNCCNNIQSKEDFIKESAKGVVTTFVKHNGEILIGVPSQYLLEGIEKRLKLR